MATKAAAPKKAPPAFLAKAMPKGTPKAVKAPAKKAVAKKK